MPTTLSRGKNDYRNLIDAFELKKLRNDFDHAQAVKASGRLIGLLRKLTHGEARYLDALVVLIRDYERTNHDPIFSNLGGVNVLRHLINDHGMSQKDLAAKLGVSESAASMILSGKRDLTKSHIKRLAELFGVGVEAFFG